MPSPYETITQKKFLDANGVTYLMRQIIGALETFSDNIADTISDAADEVESNVPSIISSELSERTIGINAVDSVGTLPSLTATLDGEALVLTFNQGTLPAVSQTLVVEGSSSK